MAPDPLESILQVRVSEVEKTMARALADRHGVKVSQLVRRLVREAYEAEFGGRVPKPKRK